jgi:hypothetical protein
MCGRAGLWELLVESDCVVQGASIDGELWYGGGCLLLLDATRFGDVRSRKH